MKLIQCDNPGCHVQTVIPPDDDHDGTHKAVDGWLTAAVVGFSEAIVLHEQAHRPRGGFAEVVFDMGGGVEDELEAHRRTADGIFHSWNCMVQWLAMQEQKVTGRP